LPMLGATVKLPILETMVDFSVLVVIAKYSLLVVMLNSFLEVFLDSMLVVMVRDKLLMPVVMVRDKLHMPVMGKRRKSVDMGKHPLLVVMFKEEAKMLSISPLQQESIPLNSSSMCLLIQEGKEYASNKRATINPFNSIQPNKIVIEI